MTAVICTTTISIDEKCELYKKKRLTDNKTRITQYVNGLQSLFKIIKDLDIYVIDNSLTFNNLPLILKELISSNKKCKYIYCDKNKYGKINKGAGIMDVWQANIDIIKKYNYIIHFEPRQKIYKNVFFTEFNKNKSNIFYIDKTTRQFHTGLFSISSDILVKICEKNSAKEIALQRILFEKLIFDFLQDYKYNVLSELGIIWYDSYKKDKETFI